MTDTLSQRSVTFAHPFSLDGVDGTYPPGTYAVSETSRAARGALVHRLPTNEDDD